MADSYSTNENSKRMPDSSSTNKNSLTSDIARELDRASSTVSRQLSELLSNSRWFTTLAIAEVAGVVKFTEASHGWKFAFSIFALLALFVAIACFIYSVSRSQVIKNDIETSIAKVSMILPFVTLTETDRAEAQEMLKDVEKTYEAGGKDADPQIFSNWGLWIFAFGTFIAGLALLIS